MIGHAWSSLRGRLFAAILATVLVAVAVSLVIGITLTRSAVRTSFADQLSHEADLLAGAATAAPRPGLGIQFLQALPAAGAGSVTAPGLPPPGVPKTGAAPPPSVSGSVGSVKINGARARAGKARALPVPPPGDSVFQTAVGPPPEGPMPRVLSIEQARGLLPASAIDALAADGTANGRATIDGSDQLFAARSLPTAGADSGAAQSTDPSQVLLLSRSAAVGGNDFAPYLGGLVLASGLAGLLAAVAAALIARRLTAPLRRVSDASGEVASGRHPEPLPEEGPRELATLASSFNEMAAQLKRAREAERSVLLSVSHELRTPLTAIRGYAEGVEDGAVDLTEAAPVIAAEAGRLERLVQDLLALARLEQGVLEFRREPIDLEWIAAQARQRLALVAAERGVDVALHRNGAAVAAIGDPDRALQVVSNLIENAVRVTATGGTVSVAVTAGSIVVSDSGPGIAPEDVPHAFDRFYLRGRDEQRSADGSGLGLAIVRELTQGMGGTVELRSEPGQGAEFTVRLPTGRTPGPGSLS